MRHLLLLLALSYGVGCTSSDEVDLDINNPDDEIVDGNSDKDDKDDDDILPDPNVEVLKFAELIQQDEYKGLTLIQQIRLAIDQISENGIIQFDSGTYYIPSDLTINKGVTLQGVGVTPTPDSSKTEIRDIAGSGEIETIFKLSGSNSSSNSIIIVADNVKFKHLRIEGYDNNTGNVVEFKGSVRNFQCENVYFNNGAYHLSPRDAMSHAIKCRYTTFNNFRNRAFFINRAHEFKEGVDIKLLEKCEFYRCRFDVWNPQTKDTRAISLDAGNTENPNILDFDGFEVNECYFYDIGFASSKCCNFNIINSEFYLKDLNDFPLHIEEYTYGALVKGCKFVCEQDKSDYLNIDPADAIMGVFDNSTIEDNIVEGSCKGFIQGRNAEHMIVRNNDLTKMVNISPTSIAVSFWDADGSRDISVVNNKFHSGAVVSIRTTAEDRSSIVVSGNSNCTEDVRTTSGYAWPFKDGALCRFKHAVTGEYLKAQGASTNTTTTTVADDACEWRVTRVWPNRYNVYSEKFQTYLFIVEDTEGYSSPEKALAAKIVPKTKPFNKALERVPIWDFTKQKGGGNIIGPGGGNHGCVGIRNGSLILFKETSRSNDAVTNNQVLWNLEVIE